MTLNTMLYECMNEDVDEWMSVDEFRRLMEEGEGEANETINEDKEFPNKRELYDYYGIDINTIPDGYEVKMRYIKVKGKMGRLYKLAKK